MKKFLTLSILLLVLTGCSKHLILKHDDESSGPADYNAMGKILGCMFAPEKCKDFSKEETTETFDEKSDKEWNEIE